MLSKAKSFYNQVVAKFDCCPISAYLKKLRKDWQSGMVWTAERLYNSGISPNLISLLGFGVGLLAINFLSMDMYLAALICILINRTLDALDGTVARYKEVTDFGVFFDATLDYIFYAGVIWGFALANPPKNAIAASFLLFAFAASACAMLSYAIIAYKNDKSKKIELPSSPFYLGGTAQGSETFVALIVLCLIPSWFVAIASILGCWCLLKTLVVISTAYYNFVIVSSRGKK